MLNWLVTIIIVLIVGYMAYAESKYLFGEPTGCNKRVKHDTVKTAKSALIKAVSKVKQETKKIKMLLQQKKSAPEAVEISDSVEYIQNTPAVLSSNAIVNTIDEDLPFSEYAGEVKVLKATNGLIEGVRPPTYADPRTMNPALAAAPVQFSDPAVFGTFGVTDQSSLAFSAEDVATNAAIASERRQEGFDVGVDVYDANGAALVMDGRIVKNASELPSAQIKGAKSHTTLPMRNLHKPPPVIEDLVEDEVFDGLQGYPVDERGDLLTPPGMATPMTEWAKINYNI